jgi:glycosyltransferase involved in cell wall biosynthesis
MKILFLPKYYEEGASSRYRTFNYLKYFKDAGIDFEVKPLLYKGYVSDLYNKNITVFSKLKVGLYILKRIIYLLFNKHKYDLLVIEKELFPKAPYIIEKILLKGVKYTLDYDDAVFFKYEKNIFLKNKVHRLSQNSALTTVGNKWYFSYIKSDKLEYLPTVVDIEKYKVKNYYKKIKKNTVNIVWIGSPSSEKYLEIIKQPLEKLSLEFDIKLIIISNGNKYNYKFPYESYKWTEKNEVELILKGDIGIMPLEENLFEKGKCGFKLIQYMACGLPVIASPLPANIEIVTKEVGFLAKNEEEWYKYLKILIEDKELRKKIGKKARKRVEKYYSYQRCGNEYLELIKKVLK